MKPLACGIWLFAGVYGGCLALHAAALVPGHAGGGAAWFVWYAAGAVCLAATALELVVWLLWCWLKKSGTETSAGVPLRLTPIDRVTLLRERIPVALLMPAHNEATTEPDREALAGRIHDTILRTPSYCTFFLLADSPHSQRDNEREVVRRVKRRLREGGREYEADRLVLEEYRTKPPALRHKCGSLLIWVGRYGRRFEHMFVLDADSSLPAPDPRRPETCEVVERMALAMRADRGLALVQAPICIREATTLWGRIQEINSLVGAGYYLPVFSWLYGRCAPCYGHNCLIRVRDFARYARNTLHYTSHDHVDSADLAAAGRACVMTNAVVTYEEPEQTLPGWLKRECRWSRGNGQWLVYLFRKRRLPAGAAVYLLLGVMQYVWALLATLLLVSGAALVYGGTPLVPRADAPAARLLLAAVVAALLVPKLVATRGLPQFLAGAASSVFLGPTLTLFQGIGFLLGAFGSGWVPRGARAAGRGAGAMVRTSATFFPAMLLGLFLWSLLTAESLSTFGGGMMAAMAVGMILSPVLALVLSWPLRPTAPARSNS